ncbi:hypothetical protein AGDE_08728 [Angomonas deanei]|uniref:Exocyst complex component Sec6, putative n=1 Tax=Angomonas deanei TaxID=59799 RepID=A0A7G2C9H2_9TRYP|nr:hypothetical protein AGDE_08728 [Angomonas deanei]CAD2215517.1 Exocyst complex component Sec6, putative [Angomonas deanei]|eukprot:EPY32367.1 hypothetical protein AGDE_08728 [Angomonas deanei]
MNVSIQKALEDNDDGSPFPQFDVLKECIQVCSEEIKQPVLNTGSDGVEREPPISQETVRAALQKSVGKLWEEQIMVDVVDPFGQISVYLEQMKKIELILEALEMTLIPLSSSFSFFGEVVLAVHGEVMHVMEGYVDPDADVEANGLMEASEFIQWYKEMMVSCNFAQYVSIASIDELSAQFMANAVEGLSEHLTRLCRACAITVCNDAKGPTVLPSGQPITTGPVDMFAVLQQSLGGLTTAVETDVMRQIGSAVAAAICAYLDECKTRSDFDYCEEENASSANPESDEVWQTRRMQYLYAFCNDCATIESNLDTIEIKFASCWEDAGDGDFSNTPFQKVQDTLPENALYYLNEITLHVERVVESQWQLVARSGPWYTDEENPVQLIVETLAEYIDEEFTVMLPDQRQRKLIIQMLVRYVVKYFNTLLEFLGDVIRNPKKYVVESWATFLECYIRDCNIAMQMWRDRITDTRVQVVDSVAKAFEVVKDLLSVKKPVDFQFIIKNNLLEDFGDCPTFFIKFTLNARTKELDSSSRDRMLGIWNESIAFQQRDKDDKPTTGWNQPPSFLPKWIARSSTWNSAPACCGRAPRRSERKRSSASCWRRRRQSG